MISSTGKGGGPGCGSAGMRSTLNVGGGACGPGSCAGRALALHNSAAIAANAHRNARHRATDRNFPGILRYLIINRWMQTERPASNSDQSSPAPAIMPLARLGQFSAVPGITAAHQ